MSIDIQHIIQYILQTECKKWNLKLWVFTLIQDIYCNDVVWAPGAITKQSHQCYARKPVVRAIHRPSAHCSHKGSAMRKVFPCHDIQLMAQHATHKNYCSDGKLYTSEVLVSYIDNESYWSKPIYVRTHTYVHKLYVCVFVRYKCDTKTWRNIQIITYQHSLTGN